MNNMTMTSAMRPLPIRRSRGQAMMEFLIALIALVPLFFAIVMLGKYLDLKSTIVESARYAAWERTIWNGNSNGGRTNTKSAATLQNEMRERLFSTATTLVQSDDGTTRSAQRAGANANWNDYANKTMLLPTYTGTTATGTNAGDPGALGKGTDTLMVILGSAGKFGSFGTSSFSPNTHGLYSAQVQVKINQPPQIIRGLNGLSGTVAWDLGTAKDQPLLFGAGTGPTYGSNVLLADAWSASGPTSGNNGASVKDQVSGLVPTSWIAAKAVMVGLAAQPATQMISTAGITLNPGKLEPDLIPADRTK